MSFPVPSSLRVSGICALMAVTIPVAASAFSGGPPDGTAGDPPNNFNCTLCHSGTVNTGDGSVAIMGLPAAYDPGAVYPLEVVIADPVQSRWGFEMTVLLESDMDSGGGDLASVDMGRTQISEGATPDDRDYAKHVSAGTDSGVSGGTSWFIDWTAPAVGSGETHFYLAGNAANNNFASSGDLIYTIDLIVPEAASDVDGPVVLSDAPLQLFPNPAPGRSVVRFALDQVSTVDLRVVDVHGRTVRQLASGSMAEGEYQLDWDGMSDQGRALPAGVYYTVLQTPTERAAERVVLVR